jgi:hypothetical protein
MYKKHGVYCVYCTHWTLREISWQENWKTTGSRRGQEVRGWMGMRHSDLPYLPTAVKDDHQLLININKPKTLVRSDFAAWLCKYSCEHNGKTAGGEGRRNKLVSEAKTLKGDVHCLIRVTSCCGLSTYFWTSTSPLLSSNVHKCFILTSAASRDSCRIVKKLPDTRNMHVNLRGKTVSPGSVLVRYSPLLRSASTRPTLFEGTGKDTWSSNEVRTSDSTAKIRSRYFQKIFKCVSMMEIQTGISVTSLLAILTELSKK